MIEQNGQAVTTVLGAGRLQLLEPHVADARARLLFLVGEQQAAAGAAAERVLAVAHRLADVGAEARRAARAARRPCRRSARDSRGRGTSPCRARRPPRPTSSRVSSSTNTDECTISTVVAELPVVVADRLHAVRARRQDLLRRRPPSGPRCSRSPAPGTCTRCRCAWPDRPCTAPSTARRTSRRARAGSRTATAATSGSRPRTRRRSRATPARRASPDRTISSAGRLDELLPLVVAEAPDVAAPLEVVVHRAEVVGRVAVRHQAAPRADEERQVLDADRALVLAGAAGRALPQHLLGCRRRRASCRARPASSASCVCRMIVFGFSSLPAPHAGQFTWQRPHSTQVNASSTLLLPRSFTVSSPTCSFSKSRFGTLPSSGDFRNTVTGDSTRWKCFDAGISARNARMTTVCTHQFTRPASARLVEPERQQKRHHQRRDEQRDDDRLDRHVRAERRPAGRTRAGPSRKHDAGEHARRQTASAPAR